MYFELLFSLHMSNKFVFTGTISECPTVNTGPTVAVWSLQVQLCDTARDAKSHKLKTFYQESVQMWLLQC